MLFLSGPSFILSCHPAHEFLGVWLKLSPFPHVQMSGCSIFWALTLLEPFYSLAINEDSPIQCWCLLSQLYASLLIFCPSLPSPGLYQLIFMGNLCELPLLGLFFSFYSHLFKFKCPGFFIFIILTCQEVSFPSITFMSSCISFGVFFVTEVLDQSDFILNFFYIISGWLTLTRPYTSSA